MDNHKGAWLADKNDKNGAKAGLMMPGKPKVGMKYYQEIAPGVAMDRAFRAGFVLRERCSLDGQ